MKVTGNTDPTTVSNSQHVHSAHSAHHAKRTSEARPENGQQVETSSGEAGAKPEISARGREFAHAKAVASGAPDVREEKIARLKEMIAGNRYHVDPHAVADRMVDEHLSSGIG